MAVVTMWLPFSRYISATPLIARLIDSVPPDVKISSLGARAPMIFAICSRARSTAFSASQPNEWFRLAGWPNFSVKYGIIASTTRGSTGVVDWASMKIGNFSIWLSPSRAGAYPASLDRQNLGRSLVAELRQAHRVEQLADRRLQLLHGALEIAAHLLWAPLGFEAAHDADRTLERAHHLTDRDVAGVSRQHVAPLGAVLAHDELPLREALQDLGEQLGRNPELFRDPLGADGSEAVVRGDVMDRH